VKRFLDVLLSFLALLVLAPFLLPAVVILRFTGEGEVFYIRERAGRGGNSAG
jgi:lipopolysaccharide/colanic/teichoic acid biosynthesis glycosyltransferase